MYWFSCLINFIRISSTVMNFFFSKTIYRLSIKISSEIVISILLFKLIFILYHIDTEKTRER